MLGSVLEHMCDRNDHGTVLPVLHVLGKAQRAGYLSANELSTCLTYCGNRFAEQGNHMFFKEYSEYISTPQDQAKCAQSRLCKSYHFAHEHAELILNNLQTVCMLIDTEELHEWFMEFLILNQINARDQLIPLIEMAYQGNETMTNDDFKQLSTHYFISFPGGRGDETAAAVPLPPLAPTVDNTKP